jgi:CubicO group peptidase (beta-lactamase class C family)
MEGDQLKNQTWVSPTFNSTADGTLYFNVLDLAKWDEALYGTQLLKQSSLDRIWTVFQLNDGKPNPANYGFGWFTGQQKGHKLIWHGGAWQGFNCNIARYPDDNLTVVVLANLDNQHSNPVEFTRIIAGLVNPQLLPAKLDAIADTQPAIKAALAKTLDQVIAGEDIRPHTTPDLAALITPEQVKLVQKMLSTFWPGGQLTLVQRMPMPDSPAHFIFIFRLSKGSGTLLVPFELAPDGRINTLGFSQDREYDF